MRGIRKYPDGELTQAVTRSGTSVRKYAVVSGVVYETEELRSTTDAISEIRRTPHHAVL